MADSSKKQDALNPITVLGEAIRAVPAVKYALGIAGIVSAIAIVTGGFRIDLRIAVFGTCHHVCADDGSCHFCAPRHNAASRLGYCCDRARLVLAAFNNVHGNRFIHISFFSLASRPREVATSDAYHVGQSQPYLET